MTPRDLDACLAELGLSEDGFASLIRVEVVQVKRWRAGEETIPAWAPMALSLFGEFRQGAKGARERADRRTEPAQPGTATPNGRAEAKLH